MAIIGFTWRSTFTILDAGGSPTDPATVWLHRATPSGVITSYLYGDGPPVGRTGVGIYYIDTIPDAAGAWRVGMTSYDGSGFPVAAQTDAFLIEDSWLPEAP